MVRRFFAVHPVASDVLVCLFAVAVLLGAVSGTGAARVGTVLLAVAATVALAWRRHRPLTVAAVVTVLALGNLALAGSAGGFDLAIALSIYAVAAARPARIAWATFATTVVVVSAAVVLWAGGATIGSSGGLSINVPEDTTAGSTAGEIASTISAVLTVGLAAVAIGISVRNRRQHISELVERSNRIVVESEQQARLASATERTRIAREMHDIVAHSLSVMIALADGAQASVGRSPDAATAALEQLSTTGRAALADMRRMLGVLRAEDTLFEPQPGIPDLDELVQAYRAAGLAVRMSTSGPPVPAEAGLQLTVYRIVQESLTNALRPARAAAQVDVLVAHLGGQVVVDVVDDGGVGRFPDADEMPGIGALPGPVPAAAEPDAPHAPHAALPAVPPARPVGGARSARTGGGSGLIGMRERAAVYGGSVQAGPYRTGWRVHTVLRTNEEER